MDRTLRRSCKYRSYGSRSCLRNGSDARKYAFCLQFPCNRYAKRILRKKGRKQGCLDRYFDDGFIYSVLIHVGMLYSGSERYIDALDKTIILQYSENSYGKPCSVYDFRAFRCPPLSRLVEFNGTNNRRKK